jgi:PPOX class probable F420-dependent enzyme
MESKEISRGVQIPEDRLDLFAKPTIAHLATLMPDGTPHVTPVWIDFDGTFILVNTAEGRQKDRNVRLNPHVALDMVDPENPYRFLAVQGLVLEITKQDAEQHIDRLAGRYLGLASYPHRRPSERRQIFKILPLHVLGRN